MCGGGVSYSEYEYAICEQSALRAIESTLPSVFVRRCKSLGLKPYHYLVPSPAARQITPINQSRQINQIEHSNSSEMVITLLRVWESGTRCR